MARAPRKADDTKPTADQQLTPSVTDGQPAPNVEQVAAVDGLPPLADLPEPSQEIFDKPAERPTGANGLDDMKRSPSGEAWDENVHENPPRINARGSWARRRGGARRGPASSTSPRAHSPHSAAPEMTPQETDAKINATAALAAGLLFLTGEMTIGECMKPTDSEREGITSAFADYFRATGTVEIPPWLGLVGVTAVYVGSRWGHPQFEAKRAKWTGKGSAVVKVENPAPSKN